MSDNAGITITGLNELGQRLKIFSDTVANKITKEAARETIKVFRDELKVQMGLNYKNIKAHWLGRGEKRVLLQPGNLMRSVRFKYIKNMPKGTVRFEVYVKNHNAWYFKFVERGTSKMSANPVLRKTFESKLAEATQVFKDTVQRAISEGGR